MRTLRSDAHGQAAWADLPMGNNTFRVGRAGFQNLELTAVVQGGGAIQRDAVLQVGSMGTFVGVVVEARAEPRSLPQQSDISNKKTETKKARKRKHWFVFW